MSVRTHASSIDGRRAELMAELALEALQPEFLSKPTQDGGYDLVAGFRNERGGTNTWAVLVKATRRRPAMSFSLRKQTVDYVMSSNLPCLLVVADVKQNQLYFAALTRGKNDRAAEASLVPLTPWTAEHQARLLDILRKG